MRAPWALPAAVRVLPGALLAALRRFWEWLDEGDPEADDEGLW
ncbi:MAG TPA: hypothetical protein VIL16_27200 [Trebonia sp.]